MKLVERGRVVITVAGVLLGVVAGTAFASITPSPYSLGSRDTIRLITNSALGTGRCDVTGVVGTLQNVNSVTMAGSVTAATLANCSGPIVSGSILFPVTIGGTLTGGGTTSVSASASALIINTVGGHCLYRGTLTNGAVSGSSFTLSNSRVPLITRLARSTPIFGICSNPVDVNLSFSLAGATIR